MPLDLEDPANKDFVDPLYGKTYLPRKFKIAFAIPPLNDIDTYTNCCGFIAIGDGSGKLSGYNLTVGGDGPQSRQCCDVPAPGGPHRLPAAGKGGGHGQGGSEIHRDFGDRADRKHARLKYVLEDRGDEGPRGA